MDRAGRLTRKLRRKREKIEQGQEGFPARMAG